MKVEMIDEMLQMLQMLSQICSLGKEAPGDHEMLEYPRSMTGDAADPDHAEATTK